MTKREGKMYQVGQFSDHPGKVKRDDAIRKECTHPCPLVWTAPCWLSDFDVSTRPLPRQCRQHRTCKADNQAQGPECVYPDSICRYREGRRFGHIGRVGWAGYVKVGLELIDFLEIGCRGILRAGSEILD